MLGRPALSVIRAGHLPAALAVPLPGALALLPLSAALSPPKGPRKGSGPAPADPDRQAAVPSSPADTGRAIRSVCSQERPSPSLADLTCPPLRLSGALCFHRTVPSCPHVEAWPALSPPLASWVSGLGQQCIPSSLILCHSWQLGREQNKKK